MSIAIGFYEVIVSFDRERWKWRTSICPTERIELGARSRRESREGGREGGREREAAVDGSAKRITGCTRSHNTSLRLPCKASENERSQR